MIKGIEEYIERFPTEMGNTLISYIYMNEGENYFILLLKEMLPIIGKQTIISLIERYIQVKYRIISKDLPINQRLMNFYNSLKA